MCSMDCTTEHLAQLYTLNLHHMIKLIFRTLFIFALSTTFIVACKKEKKEEIVETPVPSATGNKTLLCGTVTDRNGNPMENVAISAGSSTTTTNSNGYYSFNNFSCGDRCYVRATNVGFFPGSKGVITQPNEITMADIVLIESTTNFTISSATNNGLLLPNGAGVLLSPNTIANSDGSLYTGTVNVAIVHLDPTASDFAATTPGGDLIGLDLAGETNQLISYGMLMVEMTDASGNALNLMSGTTANVIMPVPPSMTGSAPDNIPLWHYNESTGLWMEEGNATLNGDEYYGSVSHFSTWNCDYPGGRSTIYGRVLDCNNNPVEGVSVTIGQGSATTNADGFYERFVPANTSFSVQVNQPELGLTSQFVNVNSTDAGSQFSPEDLLVECPAYVSFDITCNSGGGVYGFASITSSGVSVSVPINSTGNVRIAVPPTGSSAQLTIVGSISGIIHNVDVTLPNTMGQTTNAGVFEICSNGNNEGTLNTHYTIDGSGYSNHVVSYMSIPMTSFLSYSSADDQTVGFSTVEGFNTSVGFPGAGNGSWSIPEIDAMVSFMLDGNSWIMESGSLTISNWGNIGSVVTASFSGTFFHFNGTDLEYADVTNGHLEMVRNPDQD